MKFDDLPGDLRDPLLFFAALSVPTAGARFGLGWPWMTSLLLGFGVLLAMGVGMVLLENRWERLNKGRTWNPICPGCGTRLDSFRWDESAGASWSTCKSCGREAKVDRDGNVMPDGGQRKEA